MPSNCFNCFTIFVNPATWERKKSASVREGNDPNHGEYSENQKPLQKFPVLNCASFCIETDIFVFLNIKGKKN